MAYEKMHKVYLSLGSNLGNRYCNLDQAINMIADSIGTVVRCSSYIETEPWGFVSSNKFLNACICVDTELTPHLLLEVTQSIEKKLGRTLKSSGRDYHDRLIDIDILLYDELTVEEPGLIIPHPFMFERDFVMRPLSEIVDISSIHRQRKYTMT